MSNLGGMVLIGLAALAIGMAVATAVVVCVELIREHRGWLEYERVLEKRKPE